MFGRERERETANEHIEKRQSVGEEKNQSRRQTQEKNRANPEKARKREREKNGDKSRIPECLMCSNQCPNRRQRIVDFQSQVERVEMLNEHPCLKGEREREERGAKEA